MGEILLQTSILTFYTFLMENQRSKHAIQNPTYDINNHNLKSFSKPPYLIHIQPMNANQGNWEKKFRIEKKNT